MLPTPTALLAADPLQEAHYANAMRLCDAAGKRAHAFALTAACHESRPE